MELVVGGNFLADLAVLLLKEAERARIFQQPLLIQESADQGSHLAVLAQGVQVLAGVHEPLPLEPLPCSGQRPHPCLDAIADHQQHMGGSRWGMSVLQVWS